MTELGRLGAFITKVKKGSLADVVGHLRAGKSISWIQNILSFISGLLTATFRLY